MWMKQDENREAGVGFIFSETSCSLGHAIRQFRTEAAVSNHSSNIDSSSGAPD